MKGRLARNAWLALERSRSICNLQAWLPCMIHVFQGSVQRAFLRGEIGLRADLRVLIWRSRRLLHLRPTRHE